MKTAEGLYADCGGRLERQVENYHFPLVRDLGGHPSTGGETTSCAGCGRRGVSIERMAPILRGIAAAVVRKRARLAAPEVTFLRKHLGYTGARLAKVLGVAGPSVSRWESGRDPIGPSADRLLRALVVMHDGDTERFDPSEFETIEEGKAPIRLTFRRDSHGIWGAAA